MLKRTPLYESHQALNAKLIDFGGWEMPVQYTSILDEHNTVRKAAGIFDISHMGEFFVTGTGAQEFLNSALTNDVTKLAPGQGQYTLMCNERGGVVDDLYLYCLGLGNYLLIVNASRIAADFAWLQGLHEKHPNASKIKLDEKSASYGAVAVQGPNVAKFIDAAFPSDVAVSTLAKNEIRMVSFRGELIYIARTGYTGEDGFEIISPAPLIAPVWEECLRSGKDHGLKPCGLGARDTLRLESCYPLYGHELNDTTSPIEAGVGFFVALDKPQFVGAEVLREQKANGPAKRLVAFKMTGKSPPPRQDYAIWSADGSQKLGAITSGTQSPTLGVGLGLGYVPPSHAATDTSLQIEIRGNKFPAVVVKKPFYKRSAGL
ncbi:MAG TPA: glycine cleavage system aminomethyltransferase GcvT [Verrucomicrobiae bacterium]